MVSLTLARGEVPAMIALRLYDPRAGTNDAARLKRAGVPVEYRTPRSKPEIALAEIFARWQPACASVVCWRMQDTASVRRFDKDSRHAGWPGAVGIPRHMKVYPVDVKLIWPIARRGRPRKRYIPNILSRAAEDMLADAKGQNVSWRNGTKGRLKARSPPFGRGSPMGRPADQG